MKIGDDEYKALLEAWLKEQILGTENKPSGMYGNWAWKTIKEREFRELLLNQGKLKTLD